MKYFFLMINPSILLSDDGSTTLMSEQYKTTYHSIHGAIQESMHVYITSGLLHYMNKNTNKNELKVLEIGLGSCLNAILTLDAIIKLEQKKLYYHAIEKFPVALDVLTNQNYSDRIKGLSPIYIDKVFESEWETDVKIADNFTIHKQQVDLISFESALKYDVIFFDAFDPSTQPEMWTKQMLLKMANFANPNAVLVTFSAKGQVRRDLQEVGFSVERIPGPPGKREMLRATYLKK